MKSISRYPCFILSLILLPWFVFAEEPSEDAIVSDGLSDIEVGSFVFGDIVIHQYSDDLYLAANDYVLSIYKNGELVPDSFRELISEPDEAAVEKVSVSLKQGDWLVFQVSHNRLAPDSSRHLAVAGRNKEGELVFVSDSDSGDWSSCDYPSLAAEFISNKAFGRQAQVVAADDGWQEGKKLLEKYSELGFSGDSVWGTSSLSWIKYVVPSDVKPLEQVEITADEAEDEKQAEAEDEVAVAAAPALIMPTTMKATRQSLPDNHLDAIKPDKWSVQIISAIYGTGGKDADVTARVKELVEDQRVFFKANPGYLKADPNPYWNKGLRITYMKDGVRRHLSRGENGHVHPETFYGPQDAGELDRWLLGTRWTGPNGEVQFHPNGVIAGPEVKGDGTWRATAWNKVEITWPKAASATAFTFDAKWTEFSVPDDKQNNYRVLKKAGSPESFLLEPMGGAVSVDF